MSSIVYGYDLALKSLLYDRFASTIGIDISSDTVENMNQGLFQCPDDIAQREASEKRGKNFLEFMNFQRMEIRPSWDRQRSVLAKRGLWVATNGDKKTITNIKAQPVDLVYNIWFWSKSLDKVNQCMEEYIWWQQDNPKVVLHYTIGEDEYPIRPDLHFGEIIDQSTYPDKYEIGAKFILMMPVTMDAWVLKSTTLKPIRKIRLTVYDKDEVTNYSDIVGSDPDVELEAALRFFRKSIYGIINVNLLENSATIAGKFGNDFSTSTKVIIRDSTGNDGIYTISTGGISEGADSTKLILEETLADSTADGVIQKQN